MHTHRAIFKKKTANNGKISSVGHGIIPKQKGVVSAFDSMCAGAHCFGLFEVLSPMR